ncbi:MAG TPA: RdgB/HAM1 family non-canonical purine NTP pyrophosphatase [Blastocatellia bacterium]|nr:RdgB/HAM1 family non-canonical purine NTP pyrophosphatase [Blastocatellia bacterium]
MKLLLATTNRGKIKELRRILGDREIELVGLDTGETTEEIETAATFAENALLKARHYHQRTGLPTIADDSGLEVAALGGRPGVASARYAGPEASDAERIRKLLGELKDVPAARRAARFVCAAALVWAGGEQVFEDEARGAILDEARGAGGFGYDPVFLYPPLGKTFAELSDAEKAEVSHRGRAFRRLATWLGAARVLDTPKAGDKMKLPTGESSASSRRGDV